MPLDVRLTKWRHAQINKSRLQYLAAEPATGVLLFTLLCFGCWNVHLGVISLRANRTGPDDDQIITRGHRSSSLGVQYRSGTARVAHISSSCPSGAYDSMHGSHYSAGGGPLPLPGGTSDTAALVSLFLRRRIASYLNSDFKARNSGAWRRYLRMTAKLSAPRLRSSPSMRAAERRLLACRKPTKTVTRYRLRKS